MLLTRKHSILFLVMLTLTVKLTAQTNTWLKDDRNNIYNDCMSYLGKYPNINTEQRENLSLCYLDDITKKYTKVDFQSKIEIEIKKIRETTLTLCAKNLGLELTETKKETPVSVEPPKETPKKEEMSTVPKKELLIGHWKDENSEFWLFETGDYKMQYTDGKDAKGTWKIDGDQLTLYKDRFLGTSEKVFKILVFTNLKFVYQSIKNKKDTFTAVKIK
jgi:hypothetical protein